VPHPMYIISGWYTSGVKLEFFIELCKRSRGGGASIQR
jgi:hypothetical protein